uniref:Methylcytosine dioxygenase n=1 Tax=Heterorhabditis bacteriophora TaxID=37862 RepID=A0A1I7X4R0_HETBA
MHNTASMGSLEKETTTNSFCNSNVYRSEVEKQIATATVPDCLCDLAVFDAFPVEDIIRALNKSGYAIVSSKLDLDQESSCKTPTTNPRSVLKKTICLNTSIDDEVHVREFNTDSWDYEHRCTSSNSLCSTDLEYVIALSSKCSPTRLRQSAGNKALLMPSRDKISYNHQVMEDSRCISDHAVHVTLNAFVPTSTGLEERRSQLNTTSNHQLSAISECNKHQTTQDLQHQLCNTNSVSLLVGLHVIKNEEVALCNNPFFQNPENSVHTPQNHLEVMLPSNTARHDSLRNYNAKVAESSSDPLVCLFFKLCHYLLIFSLKSIAFYLFLLVNHIRNTLVSGQTINEDFTNSLNGTCEETTSINKGQRSQKFLHCIICMTHGEKNLVEGKGLPTKIQLDFVYPPSGPSLGFLSVEWDNTMGPIHDEAIIKYGQQLLKAQEVDTVEDCPRDGQHRPVNTPCLLKIVKNSMLCNTTMRKLAPFLHINATPMSRVDILLERNEVKVKSVMDASLKSVRIIVKREELHKIVHETTDSIPEMCEAITNPTSKLEINQLEVTNGLIALNKSAPELVSSIKYLEELYTSRCVDSKITENVQKTFSTINKENQLSSNEKNHMSSFLEHTNALHVEGYVQLLENERKQKEPCQLPSPRVLVSSGFQSDSPVSGRP